MDIIGGLDAAQSAGVLHRDIKPSNCFIDDDGAVKVGDFGLSISTLARDVHHDLETGRFQGTPQFAPPEQLRGEPLDIRADIYAVGATLYYLLTGQSPFDADRSSRTRVARDQRAAAVPRDLRRGIPAGLAAVVLQCLAKIPGERPRSYADLAAALRPFLPTADLPAKPGLRVLAGFADSVILSVPVLMVMALTTDADGSFVGSGGWRSLRVCTRESVGGHVGRDALRLESAVCGWRSCAMVAHSDTHRDWHCGGRPADPVLADCSGRGIWGLVADPCNRVLHTLVDVHSGNHGGDVSHRTTRERLRVAV